MPIPVLTRMDALVSVGPIPLPATEALAARDMVSLWVSSGVLSVRKADASVTAAGAKKWDGFVLAAVASGARAQVYLSGLNVGFSGLTLGVDYYLDPAVPGGITTTEPSVAGQTAHPVGKALTATILAVQPQPAAVL